MPEHTVVKKIDFILIIVQAGLFHCHKLEYDSVKVQNNSSTNRFFLLIYLILLSCRCGKASFDSQELSSSIFAEYYDVSVHMLAFCWSWRLLVICLSVCQFDANVPFT